MTEHAYRVLNLQMDEFFERHFQTFEQDDEDISNGRGETLEQYAAFQQYVVELEHHFDTFATGEGFSSSRDAFDFIQSAVSDDAIRQEEHMRKLKESIEAMQRRWEETRKAETANGSEAKDSDLSVQNGPRAVWMEGPAPQAESKSSSDSKMNDNDENDEKGTSTNSLSNNSNESKAEGKYNDDDDNGGELVLGSEVQVKGLQSRPLLNDRKGVIIGIGNVSKTTTYSVVLYSKKDVKESGEEVKLKGRNLVSLNNVLNQQRVDEITADARKAAANRQAEAAEVAPIMMFSQPIPLESLIQSVLNLGDYTTFSTIMRMKVKEHKMMKAMAKKLEDFEAESRNRSEQLSDLAVLLAEGDDHIGGGGGGTSGSEILLMRLFQSLRTRLVELTPRRTDLNRETETVLSDEVWSTMVKGAGVDGVSKQKLQEVAKFVFEGRLAILTSPNESENVAKEGREVMDATWDKSFTEVMALLLKYAHQRIDSIKRFTLELFQAHYKAVASAKENARKALVPSNRAEAK
eukprot:CAMPEP_0114335940 /NCGR_PEP_ID=MMETSP0101-20121206/5379_1 /TAXON_ID=38822 ORGANISM="Pteridomonas danica, Strain PT" /NCGR_SAMPLE_ID=MMETSP0101 /ASSEMBLY_ACC=CAM_ASM_000211 /LENGTH=518 /DNA_ID=CAMNT_0001467705 /DNA_START=27 /DNA_END=1583 /DNA_ORIENTATION=-